MPASDATSTSAVATPASRTAGFVLGANWRRPEPPAPVPSRLAEAPAIFQGIITHYVDPDLRPKLRESGDNLRLIEDLGLDSLSMIEVMLRVEELLNIRVSDEELRHFRTLGQVREFIEHQVCKMTVSAPPA